MTAEEALARIEHAAGAAGLQPVRVMLGSGRPALAGRTSEFRWRWIATRLHTFLVAAPFPPETGPAELDGFIAEATRYAKDSKGGLPRGLQTGVAALVVAVTSGASPGAVECASEVHGRQFAANPWPVLVDTASGTVTQPQKMSWAASTRPTCRRWCGMWWSPRSRGDGRDVGPRAGGGCGDDQSHRAGVVDPAEDPGHAGGGVGIEVSVGGFPNAMS